MKSLLVSSILASSILVSGCASLPQEPPPYNCYVTSYKTVDEQGKTHQFQGIRCEPGDVFKGPPIPQDKTFKPIPLHR